MAWSSGILQRGAHDKAPRGKTVLIQVPVVFSKVVKKGPQERRGRVALL